MTSNMSKNFKMKSKLRGMADGGSVADYMSGKSREQQLKEASGEWTPAAAPKAGQPDFRNVQAKVTSSYEEKKKSALQRLFGMADGGTPPTSRRGKGTVDDFPATEYDFHGGHVQGPGGPTDDKVGPVKLSNKEYVLPADTVEAVGVDKLEALRAATHDFSKSEDADGLAGGGVVDWIKDTAGAVASKLRGAAPTPANAAPSTATQSSGVFRMNPGAGVSPRTPTGTALVPETAPGRAMVPYQQGAAAEAGAASRASGLMRGAGGLLRGAGTVGMAAAPLAVRGSQTAEQQTAAGGGFIDRGASNDRLGNALDAAGNAAGQVGSYFGTALTLGAMSPQDFGGMISDMRGIGTGQLGDKNFEAVPQADRGWGRRGVEALQRGLGLRDPLPDFSNVTGGVQTSQSGPSPVAASGIRMADESGGRAPPPSGYRGNDPDLRGAGAYQGAMENLSGLPNSDPRINGSTSEAYNAKTDNTIVGSFNGRQITKGEADARAAGLQTISGAAPRAASDPMQDALISALRGGGGSGGGFSSPSSNAREINARFDSLAKNLEGRYGSKGQGNLARRLLELEGMRSNALDADARNMSSLRGQDISAANNAANNRLQAAGVAASMLRDRNAALAAGSKATADAQAKAQEMATKAEETGYKRMTDAVGGWFTGADGKPDTGEQERFMSYIQNSAPEAYTKLTSMPAQDQMQVLQMFKTQYDMDKTRNNTAAGGLVDHGVQVNRATTPTELREAAFSDVFNKHLPFKDYLYSNLPFTDNRAVIDNTGQATLLSDLGTTNGQWDAEKMAIIDRLAKKSKE